jgi:hypothetical protein
MSHTAVGKHVVHFSNGAYLAMPVPPGWRMRLDEGTTTVTLQSSVWTITFEYYFYENQVELRDNVLVQCKGFGRRNSAMAVLLRLACGKYT